MRFQCTEIIEIFMQHSVRNNSESLKRYKIISRLIKKSSKHLTDETKLALASSAFNAQVWGESQSYLDSIEIEKWDERVVKLYKKIGKKKVQKLIYLSITIKFLSEPKWFCSNCNHKYEHWQFVCVECSSVNQINWPKKIVQIK